MEQGVPQDDAIEIMDKEAAELDFTLFGDCPWAEMSAQITGEDEGTYQESLKAGAKS